MSEAVVLRNVGPTTVVTVGGVQMVMPQFVIAAGAAAVERFLEFFAAQLANDQTREAYGRAAGQFLTWCEARGLSLRALAPLHVVACIRTHRGSVPTVKSTSRRSAFSAIGSSCRRFCRPIPQRPSAARSTSSRPARRRCYRPPRRGSS
jgi:hypothetical protein